MLRAMLFALAGMVLVFLLVGFVLAREWRMDTTRVVPAAPERIAELVTDLSTWSRWSAMDADLGPQTKRGVTGAPRAAGQAIRWTGMRGTGILEVEAVDANALTYVVKSQGPDGEAPTTFAKGRIEWRAEGAGTTVKWHEEAPCRNLVERWFAWFGAIQERIRQIQEASLTGLAREAEGTPKADAK